MVPKIPEVWWCMRQKPAAMPVILPTLPEVCKQYLKHLQHDCAAMSAKLPGIPELRKSYLEHLGHESLVMFFLVLVELLKDIGVLPFTFLTCVGFLVHHYPML